MFSKRSPVGGRARALTIESVEYLERDAFPRSVLARSRSRFPAALGMTDLPYAWSRSFETTQVEAYATALTLNEVTKKLFDFGFFAGVVFLGNRAGLLAQFQAKNLVLQRIHADADVLIDRRGKISRRGDRSRCDHRWRRRRLGRQRSSRLFLRWLLRFRGLGYRGIVSFRRFDGDNLLARKEKSSHTEERGESRKDKPLKIVKAARCGNHFLAASARIAFLGATLAARI